MLGSPALRLLGLAVRTKQLPELLAGIFFAGAGVGIPLRMLGASRAIQAPELAALLNGLGHVLFALGASALYIFTHVVFRKESSKARAAAALGAFAVLSSTAWVFAEGVNSERSAAVLVTNLSRVGALAWAYFESRRYASLMRRRVALGLGDPVVADRFRLWSYWTGALAMAPLMAAVGRILSHIAVALTGNTASWQTHALLEPMINALRVGMLLCAPLAVYGVWMSFFPPARYLARVRAAAEAAEAANSAAAPSGS